MPSLRAQRLSFAHSDAAPLFEEATFRLGPGFTGLVGANGAGKSTLLRLLAGELKPAAGAIQRDPDPAHVLFCAQSVERMDASVREFADAWDGEARRLRGELRLEPGQLDRWPTLSPGERKRWQIGAALAAQPHVLLLDEPTNHLDAAARELLLRALHRYRGVGVIVSHDRALLDALTSATLRVHRGEVRLWPGSYSAARELWEAESRGQRAAHEAAQAQRKRAEQQVHEAEQKRAAAAAQKSAGARMKSRKDSDARSMGADFLAERAEQSHAQRVRVLKRAAAEAAESVEQIEIERELGGSVFASYERAARPVLFRHQGRVVSRDSRVHVAGPNGAGKTTLLNGLLVASDLPRDKVLALPQELSAADAVRALDEVRALPPAVRGRVLSVVAALGVDPDRLLASAQPSPGEARKLLLARGLGLHAWVLLLDEPTNHLDLPSVERLQAALCAYPGALLLVTHDEALAAACTRERWSLDDRQ